MQDVQISYLDQNEGRAIQAAGLPPGDATSNSDSARALAYDWNACRRVCTGAALVLFNLFALETWSICELVGAPAVALTPFVPSRPPSSFRHQLAAAHPELVAALDSSQDDRWGEFDGRDGRIGRVGWQDVDLWMWRLFLDDVGDFRAALGLTECPFLQEPPESPAGGIGHHLPVAEIHLPPATPLLVGISPTILLKPGYWPQAAHVSCPGHCYGQDRPTSHTHCECFV